MANRMSLEQVQEILFDEDDEEFFFSGSDDEFCHINQHECEKDSDEENDDSLVNDFESCSMDDTSGTNGTLVFGDQNCEICADDYDSCRSLLEDLLNNGSEDDMLVDIVDNVGVVDSSVGDNMDNDNMNDGMFEDLDIDESGETSTSTGRGRGVGRGRGAVSGRGVIRGRGVVRGRGVGRGSGVGRGRGAGRGRGHALPECTIPSIIETAVSFPTFTSVPGPLVDVDDPCQLFNSFMTDDLIEMIVTETNRYVLQYA